MAGHPFSRSSVVALLVALCFGMAACATNQQPAVQSTSPAATSAATPAASPSSPAASPTAKPQLPFLGPTGYGALKLGMTKAAAVTTGLTESLAPGPGTCGANDGRLLGSPPNPTYHDGWLFFSNATGKLIAIYGYSGITTPQGIGIGSTYAQVHAAYPAWESVGDPGSTNGRGYSPVPGNPNAHYRIIILQGKVIEISLDSSAQDCYE